MSDQSIGTAEPKQALPAVIQLKNCNFYFLPGKDLLSCHVVLTIAFFVQVNQWKGHAMTLHWVF